jgi:NTP pyrophosphatase (non-canonical NTP hydrolase)
MAMAHKGLAKLAEELGELQQVVGKALQVGGVDQEHWSGNLRDMMTKEMGDVLAAIGYAVDANGLHFDAMMLHADEKFALFQQWGATEPGENV